MMNILIADDHPIVRRGLKEILADEPDVEKVEEAVDSQDILAAFRRGSFDIVVLDITMPGRGGLEVLKDLRKESPRTPVLILSMHPEDQYGVRAMRAGAAGYLNKESAPAQLVSAIRQILGGRKYISPGLAERMAQHLNTDTEGPPHESLSDREHQVMCMISSGKTVSEIGKALSLSVKTISTYRSRVLQKMKMKSNAALTHYALKNRLIE
ncbi:MAG TPA: response regulator transcription factor [Thermodesulfobacteriota bacterium]|nr:response regulator transcription factor [Thermodesulfobacteriota bacterium]